MCPVCGFDQLLHPPVDYMICPACGTEFGYTDFNTSHDELRAQWLLRGAHWHSRAFPPPPGWNAYLQLMNLAERIKQSASETRTFNDV